MQHPVGYAAAADGAVQLASLSALLLNRWAFWQYLHTMGGAAVTGAFAVAGLGAYYVLRAEARERRSSGASRVLLRVGVIVAAVASLWQLFPSGDRQGPTSSRRISRRRWPPWRGCSRRSAGAPLVLVGQPNTEEGRIDNTLEVPSVLSILTYRRWNASVTGPRRLPARCSGPTTSASSTTATT